MGRNQLGDSAHDPAIAASLARKQTGSLRTVQIRLGHTEIASTVRSLGVDLEDALTPAEGTGI